MTYLALWLQTALAVVFGVSSLSKLRSSAARNAFVSSLRPMRLVPDRLVAPVAAVVVGAETLIALGLAVAVVSTLAGLDVGRPLALAVLLAATGLLAVLTAGVGMVLRRGVLGQCRCFGGEEKPLSVVHLVRNGVLVLIAIGAAGFSLVAATPEPAGAVVGLVAGGVTALVLVRLDDLVDLFGPVRDRSARSLPRS